MDKHNFLMALSEKLQSISQTDRQRSVDYYAEMIDDRMEEGLSEEEAVAAVGNLDVIAQNIIAEFPVVQSVKKSRRLRWWEILLLILGSPVWVSLLVAAVVVIFSLWISLWSVVISLYATAFALGASVLGCILGSFFMIPHGIGQVLIAWGAAFICASLTILLFLLSNLAAKGMIALTRLTWKGIRSIFGRKEQTA